MLNSIFIFFLTIVIAQSSFSNDKISIPIQYLPTNLNPAMANDTNGQFILNTISDGLVGWSFKEGIYPEISESWSEKASGHLIFKIKNNIKNFEGKILKCKEIERIMKNNFSINGPFLTSYKNIKSMKCLNQHELEIISHMNTKTLLSFLASPQTKIINFKNNIIVDGVGPFSIKMGPDYAYLLKNIYYHDLKNIFVSEINLIVRDDASAIQLYREKKLDLILLSNLNSSKIEFVSKDEIVAINLWSTWGIAFNQNIVPFNDIKIRHCLVENNDSNDWIKFFYPNDLPAYGPIPFGLIGYNFKKNNNIQNFKKNKENKVEIFIPKEVQSADEISIWIKNNFSKCFAAKNIKVSIVDFSKMLERFNAQEMGAYLMSFNKETISDELFFKSFYSSGRENFYNNFSKDTRKAFLELEKTSHGDVSNVSEKIAISLARDAVMIPLMHPVHKVLIRKCLENVILNPINEGYFNIKNIRNLCN